MSQSVPKFGNSSQPFFARITQGEIKATHWLTAPTKQKAEIEAHAWCEQRRAAIQQQGWMFCPTFEVQVLSTSELLDKPMAFLQDMPARIFLYLGRVAS